MQFPMLFADLPLLRFKHKLLGSSDTICDVQALSLKFDTLPGTKEPTWLLTVFHLTESKEIDIPLNEILPEGSELPFEI